MKAISLILSAATSIICAGAAFYLAAHGLAGWGWFLFVSLASIGTISIKLED